MSIFKNVPTIGMPFNEFPQAGGLSTPTMRLSAVASEGCGYAGGVYRGVRRLAQKSDQAMSVLGEYCWMKV